MSESSTVKAILQYLQLLENMGKLICMRNNSGAFKGSYTDKDGVTRKRFIRFGKPGSPDILVWLHNRSIFLEVKSKTGRQTPLQKQFQADCEALGLEYYVVKTIDEVERILKREKFE